MYSKRTDGYVRKLFMICMIIAACLIPEQAAGEASSGSAAFHEEVFALREMLAGNLPEDDAADFDGNGSVEIRDLVLLERSLDAQVPETEEGEQTWIYEVVYGQSELGRDLVCTVFEPEHYSRTMLAVFAIHGFEDSYDHDGMVLEAAARQVIEHYTAEETMHGCRLLVVSCANPDGMIDGYTNNGYGRCNQKGIDLNRDFDAAHIVMTSERNYTEYPFSASESRALRDLVLSYEPDVVLDCHGWLNYTIGDSELASVFYDEMGLTHHVSFSDNCHGYFSYWAHKQGAKALLVEFPDPSFNVEPLIRAMDRIVAGEYDDGTGIYQPDADFAAFEGVSTYTLSSGRVTTYKDMGGEETGYIDGGADLCSIERFYSYGWVNVRYPISAGYKLAYCPVSAFIPSEYAVKPSRVYFTADTKAYRRSDLKEQFGSIWSTDETYMVAKTAEAVQVIYPLDGGGWKLGWVAADAVSESQETQPDTGAYTGLLSAEDVSAQCGADFTVQLDVRAEALIGVRMVMEYDTSLLELKGVDPGDAAGQMSMGADRDGSVKLLWADSLKTDLDAVNGTLGKYHFTSKVSEETETEIWFRPFPGEALAGDLGEVALSDVCVRIKLEAPLNEVIFPDNLLTVDAGSFENTAIERVVFGESSAARIESRAFAQCPKLVYVRIPSGVRFIAQDAFDSSENVVIHCDKSSYALGWAILNDVPYVID